MSQIDLSDHGLTAGFQGSGSSGTLVHFIEIERNDAIASEVGSVEMPLCGQIIRLWQIPGLKVKRRICVICATAFLALSGERLNGDGTFLSMEDDEDDLEDQGG